MPIKTTRNQITPVRMTVLHKSTDNKWGKGPGGEGTPLHGWWEGTLAIATRKDSLHRPKKKKKLSRELCLGSDTWAWYPDTLIKPSFKMTHTPQRSMKRYLQKPRQTSDHNVHRQIKA